MNYNNQVVWVSPTASLTSADILRAEHFGSPITAMDQAKQWRAAYQPAVEASN